MIHHPIILYALLICMIAALVLLGILGYYLLQANGELYERLEKLESDKQDKAVV